MRLGSAKRFRPACFTGLQGKVHAMSSSSLFDRGCLKTEQGGSPY
jgi:hypothetical protein